MSSTKPVTAPVPSTAPTGGVVGAGGAAGCAAGCAKAFAVVTKPATAVATRTRKLNMLEIPAPLKDGAQSLANQGARGDVLAAQVNRSPRRAMCRGCAGRSLGSGRFGRLVLEERLAVVVLELEQELVVLLADVLCELGSVVPRDVP